MKKFIYSGYTKFLAVVLFIVAIVFGALTVTNAIATYFNEEERIYGFESSFSESRHFSHLLDAPESAVFNACQSLYLVNRNAQADMLTTSVENASELDNRIVVFDAAPDDRTVFKLYTRDMTDEIKPVTDNRETIERSIKNKLNVLYCADKINYYVKWNETVFTNCGAASEYELTDSQFYRLFKRDESGNVERESSQKNYYSHPLLDEISKYDNTSTIVVCTSIKEDYVETCKVIWERQAYIVNKTFLYTLGCVINI